MLKPIVSMNQMAMNESIATTCCYVWNGTSLLGSASLPHGGSLKANTKTTSYVRLSDTTSAVLNSSWYGYTGGHVAKKSAAGRIITYSTDGKDGAHNWNVKDNNGNFTTIADLIKNNEIKEVAGGFCDHVNNPTCPYYKETSFTGTFTHTGATSAHYDMTSGNKWLADHTAVQYSS